MTRANVATILLGDRDPRTVEGLEVYPAVGLEVRQDACANTVAGTGRLECFIETLCCEAPTSTSPSSSARQG